MDGYSYKFGEKIGELIAIIESIETEGARPELMIELFEKGRKLKEMI